MTGNNTDTIVAVSSPVGPSARGIVRLSGPRALEFVRRILHPASPPIPETTYRALSVELDLDGLRAPARLYLMRAPASYTREEIVELHVIGNAALQRALLDRLTADGARPAGPGEFTRRAFLNGRIDLAQAEAVERLIHSASEAEYRAALDVLSGQLSRRVSALRERLADLAASVEVALDFSDQDVEIISVPETLARLRPLREELDALLAGRQDWRLPQQRVRAVLFGPPNAGKSSLFNAFLRRQRAIVSPHPGTTRDTLEAVASIGGIDLLLVDTAGLRLSHDEIEKIAVSRSRRSVDRADVALCVLDASVPPDSATCEALAALPAGRILILLNKSDRGPCHPQVGALLPAEVEALAVSALTGAGLADVADRIRRFMESGALNRAAGDLMVNARQADLLRQALESVDRALGAGETRTLDLLASDLRDALAALGELTGDSVTEDILDRVFSNFCIGK